MRNSSPIIIIIILRNNPPKITPQGVAQQASVSSLLFPHRKNADKLCHNPVSRNVHQLDSISYACQA